MIDAWVISVVAGLLGLLLGSFLNVCSLRWPQDESVVAPPSRCPKCGEVIDGDNELRRERVRRDLTVEEAVKPLCGDCHAPSHEIEMLTDNPEAKARMRANGYEICGRCHEEYWDNYFDYYHGAAYQAGAVDASGHYVVANEARDIVVDRCDEV